jgi:tRNA threonylcarbamoyladenosine biosynthesis protein TsaB
MNSLDAVAISKGPGSYTGLRIGTSTAKGICYAIGAKLIAINTLKAMAFGISKFYKDTTLLCPMLDARRMEVYCLVCRNDMSSIEKTQAKIIDQSSFENLLAKHEMVFFGNGAPKCKPLLQKSPNATFIDGIYTSAANIGDLAWRSFQNDQFEDVAYFEPFYLKDFVAKKPSAKKLV